METEIEKNKATNLKDFYQTIACPPTADEASLHLSKPFSLYSGYLRLGMTERLNILERETVRVL